jgi:hypothetical protein
MERIVVIAKRSAALQQTGPGTVADSVATADGRFPRRRGAGRGIAGFR